MKVSFFIILCVSAVLPLVPANSAFAGDTVRVLVVTGGHSFAQKPFEAMFQGYASLECTFVALQDESEIFEDISDWAYDVLVLYNMTQEISEQRRQHFLELLDRGVGLVVLHHAMAAFNEWPEFRKICGAAYRLKDTEEDGVLHPKSQWEIGVEMPLHVEDPAHPIMDGVQDFTVVDETYKGYDLEPDNHLLLSCSEPRSQREVAWARKYGNAKVCTIQPGHGPTIYGDENYRRMVAQAILWVATE